MKNKRRIISAALLLVFVLITAASCASDADNIVGTWKGQTTLLGVVTENSFTFNEDGSGTMSTILGIGLETTYTLNEDAKTVSITVAALGVSNTTVYSYVLDGDTLTLTDGDTTLNLTRG